MIKSEILERLSRTDGLRLGIEPLLDDKQIGEMTVDLRLGYDFLVSIVTRRPYIVWPATMSASDRYPPIFNSHGENSVNASFCIRTKSC